MGMVGDCAAAGGDRVCLLPRIGGMTARASSIDLDVGFRAVSVEEVRWPAILRRPMFWGDFAQPIVGVV